MPQRTTVNSNIQAALLRQQLDLLRLEAGAREKVLDTLDDMVDELVQKLATQDLTSFNKARTSAFINAAADSIEEYYSKIFVGMDKTLLGAAEVQARATAKLLEKTYIGIELAASLPTDTFLERLVSNAVILGAPSEEWWARQSRDTSFRFANAVRQGLVAGDTAEGVVSRVKATIDVSRSNARSLVHSSIMEVAAEARMETFKKNADVIEGIRQVSTLDSSTTDICMAYDGAEFDLDGNPINGTTLPYEGGVPRHWGCRSVEVPITMTFKELGIDMPEPKAGTRASEDGPVPARMTFDDFLSAHTEEEQNEMLGTGRAELWRNGDITLQQLLDQKGNPLTLEELQDKYA